MGFPTSDESQRANGSRYNTFQNGVIYWSSPTGAHEVHGPILAKWQSLGADKSFLGLPTTDESAAVNGRFNVFQNGRIYWSMATGAHEVHGAILAAWLALGAETSYLGYATSDEYGFNGGRRNDFQGGYIFWSASTGVVLHRK